jgi:hypothetical protein
MLGNLVIRRIGKAYERIVLNDSPFVTVSSHSSKASLRPSRT